MVCVGLSLVIVSSRVAIVLPLFELKPRFGLDSVSQAARSILKWNSTDKAPQTVRPACVSCECPKNRPAEELAARTDLRRNCEFPEPAIVLSGTAARVIEPTFKCQRKVFRKEELWPRSKRCPLIPAVSWIAALR